MKLAVVILATVAAVSAQFGSGQNNQYNPYNPYNRNNQYNRYSTPAPFRYRPSVTIAPTVFPSSTPAPFFASTRAPVPVPVATRYGPDYNAEILRYGNENSPDGSYNYFYETSNGIAAQAEGVPRNFGGNPPIEPVVSQGSFSWTSPEGVPILITYVADENGYQPSGDAIPTPPPIPAQIARALEYTSRLISKK